MKLTEIITIIWLIFMGIGAISWPVNVYKLCQCDFKPSYKAEVIYTLGVFTPSCVITAWMNLE